MKPKRFAIPHIVRLFMGDEEKLKNFPGDTDSGKIRVIVHKFFENH